MSQPQTPSPCTLDAVDHVSALAMEAVALLAATAGATDDKIAAARTRLAGALDRGKKIMGHAKDTVVEGAKTADVAVRTHPYAAIGIAFGLGTMLGMLLASRRSRSRQ